jgi:hypothetical protein
MHLMNEHTSTDHAKIVKPDDTDTYVEAGRIAAPPFSW